MAKPKVYEGTLEEITARYGEELSGLRVQVTVSGDQLGAYGSREVVLQTHEWATRFEGWVHLHKPRNRPLPDGAMERDAIYFGAGE